MGLVILFCLTGIVGVAYFIYDMYNQKRIGRGY